MRYHSLVRALPRVVMIFALSLFALLPAPAAEKKGDEADILLADIAELFRKHCVQVRINTQSWAGKRPPLGEFAVDMDNERPTLVGGYWWDERHVVIEDPVLQDQFIRDIAISPPGGEESYPARVAGRFTKVAAILLEVLPNEDGELPTAHPLVFIDGDMEEGAVVSYFWDTGKWRFTGQSSLGRFAIDDNGVETLTLETSGVLIDMEGHALGLAFGEQLSTGKDAAHWMGKDAAKTPVLTTAEAADAARRIGEGLANAVLETRFRLRVKVDEDEEPDWAGADDSGGGPAEIRAAGWVVGSNHLLVPLPLPAEGIARIEEITVHPRDGSTIKAEFAGAFREYMAVLIKTETALPTEQLPSGFTMLNPLTLPEEVFEPETEQAARPEGEYIHRWRIDYELGRRRETVDYDRWEGTFRGYRDDAIVLTHTNEENGSLAFDVEGRLVAAALTPRVISARNNDDEKKTAGFRPLDFIYRRLHQTEVFDPALNPVPEDEGRRLIDFGVECQGLNADTARLFTAASETRGGRIGLLTTYVYPGSLADKLGIREHDILLRLFLEGKGEPVELKGNGNEEGENFFDPDDMSLESFSAALAFTSTPWPPRENALSTPLTATGPGRTATLEYLREGELRRGEFVTAYGEADYRNARREKFALLGLTVRPVTYETERYFRRPNRAGVIVSRVEEGGKASVAGLHQYLFITHVDGEAVTDLDVFRKQLERFESGAASSVELTVDVFGKTRLVKIE